MDFPCQSSLRKTYVRISEHDERLVFSKMLLLSVLISTGVYAQNNNSPNPFAPKLDELQPQRGPFQPICDDWYRTVALPQYGCHAETIKRSCTGELPKVHSGPYCGDPPLEATTQAW